MINVYSYLFIFSFFNIIEYKYPDWKVVSFIVYIIISIWSTSYNVSQIKKMYNDENLIFNKISFIKIFITIIYFFTILFILRINFGKENILGPIYNSYNYTYNLIEYVILKPLIVLNFYIFSSKHIVNWYTHIIMFVFMSIVLNLYVFAHFSISYYMNIPKWIIIFWLISYINKYFDSIYLILLIFFLCHTWTLML